MSRANTLKKSIETGEEPGTRKTVVFYKGKNMRLITIGRLVLELSARFALAGAQKIAASPAAETEAYLLLDWEEMKEVFIAFAGSGIIGVRPTVAIRGMWLPIGAGGKNEEKGCAFITISFGGMVSGPALGFRETSEVRTLPVRYRTFAR